MKKKDKEKKKKINIRESLRNGVGRRFRKGDAAEAVSMDEGFSAGSFGAMVHSTDPILRLKDSGKQPFWKQDLLQNISCAALLTTAIALFCMSIDTPELVLFALPCFVVYMAVAIAGSLKSGPVRWIAAGIAIVVLIVVAVIWRSTVLGGLSMLVNQFYDYAEEAQAYIYTRLPGGDEASEFGARIGLVWLSCVLGLLFALPPAKARKRMAEVLVIVIMLAFAYYGLLPSAVCIAVMIAALLAAVSRGNILSLIPVVLVALLFFGGIVLADPGENYAVSRMDENFRDRFALRSALLENAVSYEEEEEYEFEEEEEEYSEDEEFEEEEDYVEIGDYAVYIFLALGLAAAGAAAYLIHRRVAKRIAENRKGIDSKDTREAVTMMFPYTLRWLKGYGIEQSSASAESMVPALKTEFSDSYAERFKEMYTIWSEAAYSDHTIPEESRLQMSGFMKDTIESIKKKCRFRDRLRLRYRHAL